MRKSNDLTMKDAIGKLLKSYKMEDKVVALRVEELWPAVIGNTGARYTKGFRFKKGLLTIITDTPALRQEIMHNKTLVMENLNRELGGEVIKDIEIR
jgi:hypothetical protein